MSIRVDLAAGSSRNSIQLGLSNSIRGLFLVYGMSNSLVIVYVCERGLRNLKMPAEIQNKPITFDWEEKEL